LKTTDSGKTWIGAKVKGEETLEFRDVHAFSSEEAFLLSAGTGSQSKIFQTRDGGYSWQLRFENHNPEAFFDCMGFWNQQHGLAFSDSVAGKFIVIRTRDGGQTWAAIDPNTIPPALSGEGSFAASGTCLATGNKHTAWFGTGASARARVFRTLDGGNTWSVADSGISSGATAGITSVSVVTSDWIFVFGGDVADTEKAGLKLAVSRNGGIDWTTVASPWLPAVYGGKAILYQNRMILITVGPQGVFFSRDEGLSWQQVSNEDYWGISMLSSGIGWIVGPEGRIARLELLAGDGQSTPQ
jgi:photosystem II stability/assembly factor-like uncharacterized protein